MDTIELLKPILKGGIHNTNFFNGRILTAEDLKTEHDANRKQRERLGQAVGEGVVYGLEISAGISSPSSITKTLSITSGLALNRMGQTLYLPEDIQVTLIRESEQESDTAELFYECSKRIPNSIPTGTGVYILIISPASGFEGRAPMVIFDADGKSNSCGSRDAVEGVQFRLVKLNISSIPSIGDDMRTELMQLMNNSDPASISKLRNMLAHLCFGTAKVADFTVDPFERKSTGTSPYVTYGVLDELRSLRILTDCDVPLAMVYWTLNGIQFTDMWSVRRELTTRSTSELWPLPLSERRMSEAEAIFQQSQEQVESIFQSIRNQGELALIEAAKYFHYLPAAGIIPITISYLQQYMQEAGAKSIIFTGQAKGFYPPNFFKNLTYRKPVFIEGARFEALMRSSLSYPHIDLGSKEMIWLYLVRENVESIAKNRPGQPYMIFTSGHIPYQGDARYDLAHWDRGNYSSVID